MAKLPRVKVGDPVTAEAWNAVAEKLRPFTRISTSQGCGLTCATGPHGTNLALTMPQDIYARLSGSSSPYSWTNVMQAAGGTTVDRTAGLTGGTTNCYELNGKSGLAGKVVPITWTSAGDWRFAYIGYGCSADAAHFCACGCPVAFAKTKFIGDNSGTHTLTGNSNAVGGVWTTPSIAIPNSTTWCTSGLSTNCTMPGPFSVVETFFYSYRLTLRCVAQAGGDPAGWKLEVIFNLAGCVEAQRYKYSGCVAGSPNFSIAAFLPFDCDDTLLTFTLPTMLTGGVESTPGGGGSIPVTS